MNKEMLDILNELSKKHTTELAMQVMELMAEILVKEKENKELQERIDKAIEYNEHLIRDAKYHLNSGHLKKMKKILKGEYE